MALAAPGTHVPRPLGGRRLEQSTQQAGRLRRGVNAHWWHLALSAQANTAHLPLSSSPLRGLSPRPYAYGAHALPAELRRHPGPPVAHGQAHLSLSYPRGVLQVAGCNMTLTTATRATAL